MMETDVERKRRWAKIAELKKLERAERENRLKMKEKIHKYDNISCSSSTSSTSSTSSLFESDEEDEEKARYKRIAEMKALERQQRIKRQENKQKQMDTLRQQYNHSNIAINPPQITNNNIINSNTNPNNNNLSVRMPLALPQKMSLYFNAPTQPPKKYTLSNNYNRHNKPLPPNKIGVIKKQNALPFNRIRNMPTAKINVFKSNMNVNSKQKDNMNNNQKRQHVKYWSTTKLGGLDSLMMDAIVPAQTMVVKPPKHNNNNHYRTNTEPIVPRVYNNSNFMTLMQKVIKIREDEEQDDEEKAHMPKQNTMDMPKQRQTYVSNPNQFKSERISYDGNKNNDYINRNNNVNQNRFINNNNNRNRNRNDTLDTTSTLNILPHDYHQIKVFNKSNITIEDSELRNNNSSDNNDEESSHYQFAKEFDDYDENNENDENTSSASEIPELPHDIGPPPQNKINENISFQDIGMKTMTVNAIEEESINDNNDIEESVNDIERALAYANNNTNNNIKIDRYGFRVKNDKIQHENDKMQRENVRKEKILLQQWQNILFPSNKKNKINWDNINNKKSSDRNKISDLLKKGAIPQPFRSLVWCNILNVNEIKNKIENKGLYNKLILNENSSENIGTNKYEEIIWKDIYRTFRDNIKYENKDCNNNKINATESQKSLYNVLSTFSTYNIDIGYCQGMQAISALLLMYMNEEDVFWILNIIAKSNKYGNLANCWNMSEIHLRFKQFEFCFKQYLPKLYKHLNKYNISNVSMFGATSWFITIFISSSVIDFDLVVRIWDIYLFKGIKIIFQIGIAYLSYLEKQLLKTNSFEILITTLNNGFKIIQENKHNDKFIQSALNVKIKRKQLDKWAKKHSQM